MWKKNTKNRLYRLFQFFVVWLLFQFLLHTLVTYQFGFDWSIRTIVRLWKELLIVWLWWWLARRLWNPKESTWHLSLKTLWRSDKIIRITVLVVAWLSFYSLITTVLINDLSLGHWVWWLKYNLFPLVIFLVRYVASYLFDRKQKESLIRRMWWVLVVSLLCALWRYFVIATKPWTLQLFGYDSLQFEWVVGESPPAVYRTAWDVWMARNQFLFERPTVRWFFLIAFWPLYFLIYLNRKHLGKHRFERSLFALGVFLTFSRAARWVWLIETILLFLMMHRHRRKRILLSWAATVCVLWGLLFLKWDNGLLSRSFSDLGHIKELARGSDLFIQKPLFWHWSSTAGPGSHQFSMEDAHWFISEGTTWFNPENQFLQWLIEYGFFGFALLMLFYWTLVQYGRKTYKQLISSNKKNLLARSGIFMIVWLLALFAEWMVLHSFADRMVVYPLFAFLWLTLVHSSWSLD